MTVRQRAAIACLLAMAILSLGVIHARRAAASASHASAIDLLRVAAHRRQADASAEISPPSTLEGVGADVPESDRVAGNACLPAKLTSPVYNLAGEDSWRALLRRHEERSTDVRRGRLQSVASAAESDVGTAAPASGPGPTAHLVCEPNQYGAALIHRPIPFGFVFEPDQYPGGRIELRNQQGESLVVEVDGGQGGYTVNGAPATGTGTYAIGDGLEIHSSQPLRLHVHPGSVAPPTDPQGNG